MQFPGHRLRPAFNSEFACVIECVSRKAAYTCKRRDVENQATAMIFLLAHDFDSVYSNTHDAEEESFQLIVYFLLSCAFGIT